MTPELKFIAALIDFIKFSPVSSGVCCCGDSIEDHPSWMNCGHEPVDMWDYSVSKFIEEYELKFKGVNHE